MSVIIVPILTSGRGGLPEWPSRLTARVRRALTRLAITARQGVLDCTTRTRIAFGWSPSETDLQKMPVGSTVALPGLTGVTKIAADRWRADPALPIEQTLTSRQITDSGVISCVHIPARPPAPMPWHEAL